jgi:hypothetical protein
MLIVIAILFPEVNFSDSAPYLSFHLFRRNNMQQINVCRRILCITALLTLTACADTKIGDMSRPLMPPGYGLVASTVVFSNPTQPAGFKFGSLLYHFGFDDVDGKLDSWSTNLPQDATFKTKSSRAMEDDAPPDLLLTPVKPGKYQLKRVHVTEGGATIDLSPKNTQVIEVVAGQVTYIGVMWMTYFARFTPKGTLQPRYMEMKIVNDFERDINELKSLDNRLESVVIKNALKN